MDYRTSKNLTYLARGTSENLKIFLPLGYYVALFNVLTSRLLQHDQSRPPCISSGALGTTMQEH